MVEGTPLLRVQAGNRLESSNLFLSAISPIAHGADWRSLLNRMLALGARIAIPPTEVETGLFAYLRHPDGALIEYVQWKPDLVAEIIG